jgi:hypothetical protein
MAGFAENWLLATLQRLEVWSQGGSSERLRLAFYERRNYRTILAKGVGICSQASLAIADYLGRQGLPARIASLDGHVVAATEANGQPYLLDADFDVVLPMSLHQAESDAAHVAEAYVRRGYAQPVADRLARLYGREGNQEIAPDDYMPSAAQTLMWTQIGAWTAPLAALAIGLWLAVRSHSQRRLRTSVPTATR